MMLLLGHDKFSFIRLLRKNKSMVLYCTLLATAQSAKEKKEIEEKMSSDPDLASILHALTETEQEDLIQVRHVKMCLLNVVPTGSHVVFAKSTCIINIMYFTKKESYKLCCLRSIVHKNNEHNRVEFADHND